MPPSINPSIVLEANPNSSVSESFRSLRFNLDSSVIGQSMKSVAVTSAGRGEGKTFTALNLAAAYAQIGKRVVLLDADLRSPCIHLEFEDLNNKGLSDYLAEHADADEIVMKPPIENLSYIPAGKDRRNPAKLLAGSRMDSLMAALQGKYDKVIVDTTALLTLTDAKMVAARCDGVLLVVEHGKLKRDTAKLVKSELILANAKLAGVVYNKINNRAGEDKLYQ